MIKGIFKGVAAYFRTLGIISKLKLWKYFGIPMLISLVLAVLIGSLSYSISGEIGDYISSFWTWEFGKEVVNVIGTIIGGLFIIVLGLILFKNFVLAFSAPFMGSISEKIEFHLTGQKAVENDFSMSNWFQKEIGGAIIESLKEIVISILILLIAFIPVIGFVSVILLFLSQAYSVGVGCMDYTLERHLNYKESKEFSKRNKGVAIGIGILFIFFVFIPVLGAIIVLPLSITAASLVTIEQLQLDNKS